jgi:hypothetical protein
MENGLEMAVRATHLRKQGLEVLNTLECITAVPSPTIEN